MTDFKKRNIQYILLRHHECARNIAYGAYD